MRGLSDAPNRFFPIPALQKWSIKGPVFFRKHLNVRTSQSRTFVCVSYLALVEVINDLLVKLVLKLSLRSGLVAVSLGQVGGALLV